MIKVSISKRGKVISESDSGVKRGAFKELASIIPDGYNFNLADGLYDTIMQVILTEDRYLK